jgi:hypothetical protein
MKRQSIIISLIAAAFLLANKDVFGDTVYVSNGGVNVTSPDPGTVERFAPDATASVFANTSNSPRGLAFDAVGNLFVAYPLQNTIEKFSPTGVDLGAFTTTGLDTPEGLAFDSLGNLYVANLGNKTIRRFSSTGFDLGMFASTGLTSPFGIAFDPVGNLYAANADTGNIEKFNQLGVGSLFASGSSGGQFGLAFDVAGNLYAATGSSVINKFTPAGVRSVFAATTSDPFGLAFDSSGNLYASLQSIDIIEKFSASGIDLGPFATTGLVHPNFIAIQSVPEPATFAIGFLAAATLLVSSSRKRHQKLKKHAVG